MSDPIIEPTAGRIVWYYNDSFQDEPLAAIVTKVHGLRTINVCVFHEDGYPMPKQEITLLQADDTIDQYEPYCKWMPYQVGQARKQGA